VHSPASQSATLPIQNAHIASLCQGKRGGVLIWGMTYFIHPCVEPDRNPRAWRALDCGSSSYRLPPLVHTANGQGRSKKGGSCCSRSPRCLRHRYSYDCLPGELPSCVPPHPCPQSFLFSATLLGDPSKSFPKLGQQQKEESPMFSLRSCRLASLRETPLLS
jgi:hypothetical protein